MYNNFMYGGYYGYSSYLIYILPGLLLAMWAQFKIKSSYSKYIKVDSGSGMTGAEVARYIMDRNGLYDVKIERINGTLSDNYNPQNKVLSLSSDIYNGRSIASVGVAAHEVGHALQHQANYVPLKIRGALVPAAMIGSQLSMVFIVLGLFFQRFFITVGIALFAIAVLFQIVTLPVEFDASRRAQKELARGILNESSLKGTREILVAAALTYVASTLVAIGQLLRLLAIYGGRRRE